MQFLSALDGTPPWVSEVEPGATLDITAARIHALPALYKDAAEGLLTFADRATSAPGSASAVSVRHPKGRSEQACTRTFEPGAA
nr:hypothetical protein [Streptomyces sp. RLB1-33]QIY68010.1 hypothetical protein HEP84_00425 [Streptomyces sp. RLB1-33]